MSNESRGSLENNFVPDQKILKGIFDVVGILAEGGRRRAEGTILTRNYSQPSTGKWDDVINIFVSIELAKKGVRDFPAFRDRAFVLTYSGAEMETIEYSLYNGDDGYRIEKETWLERKKSPESRLPSLAWYLELKQKGRLEELGKKLGYAVVDVPEAQKLLALLNQLVEERTR